MNLSLSSRPGAEAETLATPQAAVPASVIDPLGTAPPGGRDGRAAPSERLIFFPAASRCPRSRSSILRRRLRHLRLPPHPHPREAGWPPRLMATAGKHPSAPPEGSRSISLSLPPLKRRNVGGKAALEEEKRSARSFATVC